MPLQKIVQSSSPREGHVKATSIRPSTLTQLKSTDMFDASTILKQSAEEAKKLNTQTGMDKKLIFTTQDDTQDEADRCNYAIQATIVAKEGTAAAITRKVGSDIIDTVLCNADGNDNKGVNEYMLYDDLQVALQGTIHPNMNKILSQKVEVINHCFDIHKKVATNMEVLLAKVN